MNTLTLGTRRATKQTFATGPTDESLEVQAAQTCLGFISTQTSRGLLSGVIALWLGMLVVPSVGHAVEDCAGAGGDRRIARSVSGFLGSIGVNHHLGASGTVYANPDLELRELSYLGVTLVRDQVPTQADLPAFRHLAARGIKFNLITSPAGAEVARSLPEDIGNAGLLADMQRGSVVAIEGPNELNGGQTIYWHGRSSRDPAVAVAVMGALSAAVRASAPLNNVAVVNFSINNGGGDWRGYLDRVGDLSHLVDYANWHIYFADGRQPNPIVRSMARDALRSAPGRPIAFTEAGYPTAAGNRFGVDETTQAIRILNLLADAYREGIAYTYIYELMDGQLAPAADDNENTFGLFRADGTAKKAATAIHNLVAILGSPVADAAGAAPCPDYRIGSLPSTGSSLLLSGGGRAFDILIWNEGDDWDAGVHARRRVRGTPTELSFATPHAEVSVFDPFLGADAVLTAKNASSVSLNLADHLLVVRVSD
jgi:hypothetical protein